jgi:2,3-bisphosphoglycerate-independent phosphoglycerate mutase
LIFLPDGMADEPLPELAGRTPLEAVPTPGMDSIAAHGASGTFLSLPKGFPTSSDVANLSVLGYDLPTCYPGRGPLEAVSKGIRMVDDDVAFRCNLITEKDGILVDYSAGHIDNSSSSRIFSDLQKAFGNASVTFHPGVSYRNLLILHGAEFSPDVEYHKPDSSQGESVADLLPRPLVPTPEAERTARLLVGLMDATRSFLVNHPENRGKDRPANLLWPWSPGRRPSLPLFSQKYPGFRGAVISAVDVIQGIARCAGMDVIEVEGATGFIDTNYRGKAEAAIEAMKTYDFVYLHVEATDECSHMGDLDLKMKAIRYFDDKIVAPVLGALGMDGFAYAVLPDHPVPVHLRKHTRIPVPVSVCGPHVAPDSIAVYSEPAAPRGRLGLLRGDELMRLLLNLP